MVEYKTDSERSVSMSAVRLSPTSQKEKTKKRMKIQLEEEEKPDIDSSPPAQNLFVKRFFVFGMPATRWIYADSRPNSAFAERPKLENILKHITGEHPATAADFEDKDAPCACWKCRIQKSMAALPS